MNLGDVLCESESQLRYVHFPTRCIISLLYVMEDGASAEIAIVGNELLFGISLFKGGETTPSRALVQSAGLIRYRRGTITVLDRPRLEARSCECDQVVKTEFDHLLRYVAK